MTEIYRLEQTALPIIPLPHDCVIAEISEDDEYLVFRFEDDLGRHESIQLYHPTVKSLIMRFHKTGNFERDAEFYKFKRFKGHEGFIVKPYRKLFKMTKRKGKGLEYLGHYLAANSMVIELCGISSAIVKLHPDLVEMEWIENEQ